jgi:hypothetical protein
MNNINIILIILGVCVIFLVVYLIMTFNKISKPIEIIKIKQEVKEEEIIIPKPKTCEQTIVLDYDEINLNELKKNSLETKIDLETQQKAFDPRIKLTKVPYVRTYMDLPGYKGYNLELLNNLELKDNNNGLINYNKLKENERFKAKNSLLYS